MLNFEPGLWGWTSTGKDESGVLVIPGREGIVGKGWDGAGTSPSPRERPEVLT